MITDEMIEDRLNEMLLAFEKSPDHNFSRFAARRELEREAARPATAPELTEDRVAELARESSIVHSSTPFATGEDFKAVVRHIAAALHAGAEPPKPDPVAVAMKAYDKAVREGCNPRMGSVEAAIRAGIAADREGRV